MVTDWRGAGRNGDTVGVKEDAETFSQKKKNPPHIQLKGFDLQTKEC